MKYFYDDKEITKEKAYKIIQDFVKWYWRQDFSDFNCDCIFDHPKYNSFTVKDQATGEQHIVSSRAENYIPVVRNEHQLRLF